jgi:hypothetical protein
MHDVLASGSWFRRGSQGAGQPAPRDSEGECQAEASPTAAAGSPTTVWRRVRAPSAPT